MAETESIPEWVKNNAEWWANDEIPDSAFIDGLEFLINNGIINLEKTSTPQPHSELLTWDELVEDAKYAYDGSTELKNILFAENTEVTTRFNSDLDAFAHIATYDFIRSGIGMYSITSDNNYLDQARRTADFVDSFFLTEQNLIFHYDPMTGHHYSLSGHTNQELVYDFSRLALIDTNYVQMVDKLTNEIIKSEINSETNLFYTNVDAYGNPRDTDMYISYGAASGISSLLIAYEATSNEKYLNQAKNTLLAYWDLRSKDTNLLPSMVNADTKEIKQEFMQQYGAGIFLKLLLHYYYLTDDPEIMSIMMTYSDSVIEHFWDGKTWDYRVNYDGTILSNSIEANFGKLDDALFLLHELDPVIFDNVYQFAKSDYNNSLKNDLILENNLIIHSVKDDGSKDSPQSMMTYAFLINQNIAYRLYHDTGNVMYLQDFHKFYDSLIKNHKRQYGYITGINAYSLENTELGVLLNQVAPASISNKINLTFVPSDNVRIIWTIIGNHELSQPFITTFHDPGRFNNVEFDYKNRLIDMKTVYGKGTIIFADKIKSVIVDGVEYNDFKNFTLNTLDGKHHYQVFLE